MTGCLLSCLAADPYAALDGALAAPAGTPQYATILNGYSVKPPFKVPGVHYATGYPSGTTLADPNTLSIAGVTVTKGTGNGGSSSDGNFLTVTGNNVVIDSYDFSLHGGWSINVSGNNCSIIRCNIKQLATCSNVVNFETSAIGGSVTYCVIDGNNGIEDSDNFGGPLIKYIGGGGTFVLQYCRILNAFSDMVNVGGNNVTIGVDIRFNTLEGAGMNNSATSHPDWFQIQTASGTPLPTFNPFIVNFNLWYQPTAPLNGGSQGITAFQHTPAYPVLVNPDISYNVIIALFPGTLPSTSEDISPFIALSASTIQGVGTITNNYSDTSGNITTNNSNGNFIQDDGGGSQSGSVTVSGNVSMIGKTLSNLGGGNYKYV